MRPLSGNEAKALIDKNPAIFTNSLGELVEDTATKNYLLKNDPNFQILRIHELINPFLKQIFPKASFFKLDRIDINPHFPYLIAVVGDKLYSKMPFHFNRLLSEHGLELNDKSIIELAKAFVVVALKGQEVTFLTGKKIKNHAEAKKINKAYEKLMLTNFWYRAYLKIKIGDGIQEWFFGVNPQDVSFFGVIAVGYPSTTTGNLHLKYNIPPGERKQKGN